MPSSPSVRSLLAYLIFHHDRPISRDRLAGIFWPDRSDSRARRALSQALWQIRSELDVIAGRLITDRQDVAFELRARDRLDVIEFEQLANSRDLRSLITAAELYRADFLEGVYDDWALLERERLRELYLQVLSRLSGMYKQRENYAQSLVYAQRLVAADPLHEEAHCEVMRLYHLVGRSQAAMEQFAELSDLLEKELGVSPATATVTLYEKIAHEAAIGLEEAALAHLPTVVPPPLLRGLAHLPLVGRAGERARLLHGLQACVQGCGGHALVEGDAGVGKTRLVGAIVDDAQWRGFQVGLAKAEHPAASGPYHLLREALSPLLTPLRVTQLAELIEPVWLAAVASILPTVAQHLPNLGPADHIDPHQEQQRLWEGIRRCMMGLATISPLLLVLEDVHWADETTLAALPHLASNLPAGQVFLILTARTAEARQRAFVWETLEALDRAVPLLRVSLPPFDSAETIALVKRALGAAEADTGSTDFGRRLQEKTGGNALFLVEVLKSLLEQGTLAPSSAAGWRLPTVDESLPTPSSVQELVAGRLARLDAARRGVLNLIAVLGEDAVFPVIVRASDEDAAELSVTLEALKQRGFLGETKTGYGFEHDQIRDIVYTELDPDRRLALHRRAGRALEALQPQRVESLAYHFLQGELWDEAVAYNRHAGNNARAVYANAEAAAYYTQALRALERLTDPLDLVQAFDLRLSREAVYALLGAREAQAQDLAALDDLAKQMEDDQRRIKVMVCQICYLHAIGDYSAAGKVARQVIDLAQRIRDVGGETAGRFHLGTGHWLQGDCGTARPELELALTLACRAQTLKRSRKDSVESLRQMEGEILRLLGNVCAYSNDYAEAIAYYERSLHICREVRDRQGEGKTLGNIGSIAYDQGDYAKSKDCLERALSIVREIGDRQTEANTLTNLGFTTVEQGDYAKGRACLDQALHIYREIQDRHGVGWLLNYIAQFAICFGDYAEAAITCEQALRLCRQVGDRLAEAWGLANLSLYAHTQGDNEAAQEYAQQAVQITQELGERFYQAYALKNLGHALNGLGRLTAAAEAYQRALDLRRELGQLNLAVDPLAGLADICLAQGDVAQAQMYVEEILEYIKTQTLTAVNEPLRVYLTCYRVLCANQSPRAESALQMAYRLLRERATKMGTEAMQHAYLENVAAHRQIVAAFRRTRRETVYLPHAEAPTGRPLRDDELVEVTWTVAAPQDDQIAGKVDRRRHRLLRLLHQASEQSAAPTVADLAAALEVSARTVRRDLDALRAQGHRVHTRGTHA